MANGHEQETITREFLQWYDEHGSEKRVLFDFVEVLMILLLVNPASSATEERSFSSLRRPKTYLRSTCGQQRLSNIAVGHVHKDVFDKLNVNDLINKFVMSKENRASVFGGHLD